MQKHYTLNSIKLSGTNVIFHPVGQRIGSSEVFNITEDNQNRIICDENKIPENYGHAEGSNTSAGWRSHTEGYLTFANNTSHAEGRCSIATGRGAHAEGAETNIAIEYEFEGDSIPLRLAQEAKIDDDYIIVEHLPPDLLKGDIISIGFDESTLDNEHQGKTTDNKIIEEISPVPSREIIGEVSIPAETVDEQAYWSSSPGAFESYYEEVLFTSELYSCLFFGINGKIFSIDGISSHTINFHSYNTTEDEEIEYCLQEGDVLTFFDLGGYELKLNKPFRAANYTEEKTPYGDGKFPTELAHVKKAYPTEAIGDSSHAEGIGTRAISNNSHAEGRLTQAGDYKMNDEGQYLNEEDEPVTKSEAAKIGSCSHAEGHRTLATGDNSHAEGFSTKSTASCAHAEGNQTEALGIYSHSEGSLSKALSNCSHAEGCKTTASGIFSHAEGYKTTSSGENSHAEGWTTIASGSTAHAEGSQNEALGAYSHAEGIKTVANGKAQHVQGRYSLKDTETDPKDKSYPKYAHIVGNGTSKAASNAHTLDWSGNAWYQGTVECDGIILTSPNGTRYKMTINDDGEFERELLDIIN